MNDAQRDVLVEVETELADLAQIHPPSLISLPEQMALLLGFFENEPPSERFASGLDAPAARTA